MSREINTDSDKEKKTGFDRVLLTALSHGIYFIYTYGFE